MAKSIDKLGKKKISGEVEDQVEDLESEIIPNTEKSVESGDFSGPNLQELDGVGPAISEKLHEGGFTTYESISVASPKELAALTGIGDGTAAKIIASARSKLNIGFTTAEKLLSDRKQLSRLSTGSEKLDGLLAGGIETRSIIEVFGEFRTGKTQLAHQLCITVQRPFDKGGLSGAALYIDSEGTFRPERLLQIAQRFKLDEKEALKNVFFARAYNSDHQSVIIDSAPKLIQEKNVKLIIVDSIMSHFRAEYIGRGTLSERQQKLNKLVHKLLQIAEAYNIVVFMTNQVMDSPGVLFGDPTRPIGGHVLAHTSTYRLYLRKSKGTKRVARLIDSPCLPEGEALFDITENGIEDL
ncbi:MAG: DNA repair and recombination protein RadA [Candidatus Helarchaeota archaeon]|nr:DNA repair and recombination protein RadA [Candidatus Helarchaeota archaeon]